MSNARLKLGDPWSQGPFSEIQVGNVWFDNQDALKEIMFYGDLQ